MEGTDVFRVELWWNFFQIYISSERGNIKIIFVDFNNGLDIFRLKWRPSFRRLSSPSWIFFRLCGTLLISIKRVWFNVNLLHNSHHEVVEVRHLSRIFGIHWSDDGKLVCVFVDWKTNTLSTNPNFLTFIRICIDLIQIGFYGPLLLFFHWWSPSLIFGWLTFGVCFSRLQRIPLIVKTSWSLLFGLWY